MKKSRFFFAMVIAGLIAIPAAAMQGHDSSGSNGGAMQTDQKMDHGAKDNQMDHTGMVGTFTHTASEGGVDATFQVMSLASMNMASEKGETHHIMVELEATEGGAPIESALGKIKVIAPDKSEQERMLNDYNGILAANFTFKEPGKYGVICLVKLDGQKQVFKFWYHHM